jgi:hypothetical protein
MEIQKRQEQTQLTAVTNFLQGSTGRALAISDFKTAGETLPSKIENTFDQPKVREMILAVGEKSVAGYIEFELIRLADRVNVSGNLTPLQVEFIAKQLVGMYPTETLADFKICFERGAAGAYGKIFKLDGIEIGQWMAQYLEQKYKVIEDKLMNERDEYKKVAAKSSDDWLKLWAEAILKTDQEGRTKTISQNMDFMMRLKGLTEKEYKEQGGEKPAPRVYVPEIDPAEWERRDTLHKQYLRENYHIQTGEKLPNWISEEDWMKQFNNESKSRR